jgi:hypothetical protein
MHFNQNELVASGETELLTKMGLLEISVTTYYDYILSYCDTNQIIFIFVYDASLYTYLCFLQHRKTRKETYVKINNNI